MPKPIERRKGMREGRQAHFTLKTPQNKPVPGAYQLTSETGGWITRRVPQPGMNIKLAAVKLLSDSVKSQPGNLRFATDGHQTYLFGELRDADGILTLSEAHQRLSAPTNDPPDDVSPVEVACLLGETGYEWSTPDKPDQWRAVVNDPDGRCYELTATIIQGGVELRGRLAGWETDLAEASRSAIGYFLAAAHDRVRFARFTLQDGQANAVSFATADRLDIELPDSVAATVTACRLVWLEIQALADDRVARAYLETIK